MLSHGDAAQASKSEIVEVSLSGADLALRRPTDHRPPRLPKISFRPQLVPRGLHFAPMTFLFFQPKGLLFYDWPVGPQKQLPDNGWGGLS